MADISPAEPERACPSSTESPACWICLEDASSAELYQPCRCPRLVHKRCSARWQLQSAGRSEESSCRFCHQQLPDWKASMAVKPSEQTRPPVMAIVFRGKTYHMTVKPGPDGLRHFKAQVRKLLGVELTDDFKVTFECQVPESGERLKLDGLSAYGAATHCAAITANQEEVERLGGPRTMSAPPSIPARPADLPGFKGLAKRVSRRLGAFFSLD